MGSKTEADSNDVTENPHDNESGSEDSLNDRVEKHSAVRLYSCRECGKSFSLMDSLQRHMNVHTARFKCPECGKCFASNSKLARHSLSHSGEKLFECTVCYKRFVEARYLVKHRKIHSGEKVHYCHVCDKAFNSTRSLKNHLRVHTGDKAYKCSLCNESFSQSSSLQTHECHVHSDRKPCGGNLFKTNDKQICPADFDTAAKLHSCTRCSDCFAKPELLRRHLLKSHNEGTCLKYISEKKFDTD